MARHARRALVAVAAACLAAVLVAPQAGANSPDSAVQFIRGQGSDSTYDIMQKLDFAFNNSVGCLTASQTEKPTNSTCIINQPPGIPTTENYDHDVALSFFPVGSSNGITILDKFGQPSVTRIDYARSSRVRKSGTAEANLRFVAFARDGIPWLNFREGPGDEVSPAKGTGYEIENLTIDQMKGIWVNCSINSWNDINASAPDVPIYVWTSQPGSGERASFDAFLGGGGAAVSDSCIPTELKDGNQTNGERVVFENDPIPVRNCATFAGTNGSCPSVTSGGTTYGGTQLSVFHMGYGTYFAWATPPGTEKAVGADLGSIEGVSITRPDGVTLNTGGANPATDPPYPALRQMFNVYRKSYSGSNVPGHAYDYISEEGWICRVGDFHAVNPRTGVNYADEIAQIITSEGMAPLPTTTQNVNGTNIQSRCLLGN